MINNEPKVAILILNWNNYQDTIECLESVMKLLYSNCQVILLDNGSTDGSIDEIKKWAEEKLHDEFLILIRDLKKFSSNYIDEDERDRYLNAKIIILRSSKNLGFAEGNNKSVEFVFKRLKSVELFFLLNNDTILEPDSLGIAVGVMQKKMAAVVGFLVKDIHGNIIFSEDNRPPRLFYIRSNTSKTGLKEYGPSTMVLGCAMLIGKNTIKKHMEKKGYFFNKKLFLYGEETEFCLWVKKNRGRIYVAREAVVYHKISRSLKSYKKEAIKIYYTTRNSIFIANSILNGFWLAFFHFYFPLVRLKVFIQKITTNNLLEAQSILFGLCDGYRGKGGKWGRAEKRI